MDWQLVITFMKRGGDAIAASLISTAIYTGAIATINSIKVARRIRKIKSSFEQIKDHFKELCNGSFVITPKCIKGFYIISENYKGGYRSLLSDFDSQRSQIIKLSKYSFVKGKHMDEILDAISIYDNIIYRLTIISETNFNGIPMTFDEERYRDDASKDFEKLDKFFKIK